MSSLSVFSAAAPHSTMVERNNKDEKAKKVVLVTGGTGLVGKGIESFIATGEREGAHTSH